MAKPHGKVSNNKAHWLRIWSCFKKLGVYRHHGIRVLVGLLKCEGEECLEAEIVSIMWIPEEMSQDFKNRIYLFVWIMAFGVKKSIKLFAPFGSKTFQGDALFLMIACSVSVRISLWLGECTPFQERVLLRHALSWLCGRTESTGCVLPMAASPVPRTAPGLRTGARCLFHE